MMRFYDQLRFVGFVCECWSSLTYCPIGNRVRRLREHSLLSAGSGKSLRRCRLISNKDVHDPIINNSLLMRPCTSGYGYDLGLAKTRHHVPYLTFLW